MTIVVIGRGPDRKPHPKSRYNAARRRAIQDGTWAHKQAAEPIRAHIKSLMEGPAQLRTEDIANEAGLPYGTVKNICQGRSGTVTGYAATRILAVQPTARAGRKWIDAIGTRRRLHALAWMQWSCIDVGARLGVCGGAVARWGRETRVHESTATKVQALFEEISGTTGPSPSVRARAIRLGWAPPLAWDDIDDPGEQPNLGSNDRADDYDETTVGQACEGRLTYAQIAVHRPDLIETVRRLAKTITDQEISHLLRWPGANDHRTSRSPSRATNSITKLRHDNDIPACTRPASIAPRIRTKAA